MNNTQITASALALGAIGGLSFCSGDELIKLAGVATSAFGSGLTVAKIIEDDYREKELNLCAMEKEDDYDNTNESDH